MFKTLGALASAAWVADRGFDVRPGWFVEVVMGPFELSIYPEEWGFKLEVGPRCSTIRVTDVAFVHGRDDFALLARTPDLAELGPFVSHLEREHDLAFARHEAVVHSNLVRATPIVRAWLIGAGSG